MKKVLILYIQLCSIAGDWHCTSNVHILLHLPDAVRSLGPLWAHSTFPFEGMNGWLSELYHGTRDPQKQVYIHYNCFALPLHMEHSHLHKIMLNY